MPSDLGARLSQLSSSLHIWILKTRWPTLLFPLQQHYLGVQLRNCITLSHLHLENQFPSCL